LATKGQSAAVWTRILHSNIGANRAHNGRVHRAPFVVRIFFGLYYLIGAASEHTTAAYIALCLYCCILFLSLWYYFRDNIVPFALFLSFWYYVWDNIVPFELVSFFLILCLGQHRSLRTWKHRVHDCFSVAVSSSPFLMQDPAELVLKKVVS